MTVKYVLQAKGSEVATISPDATLTELVDALAEHGIGAMVVSSDGETIAGIVSALILWLAKLAYVPIALSPLIVGGCLGLVLMVAIASGLIALGQLSKADPAALLR